MYTVSSLDPAKLIKRLVLNNVSPINPSGFHVAFGIVVDDAGDVRFQLMLIDDISGLKWLYIPFSELLTARYIPGFVVDSNCFWEDQRFYLAKIIWQEAAAMAVVDLHNPKVVLSHKGKNLIAEFSFGRFYAKTKIPFVKASGFLK